MSTTLSRRAAKIGSWVEAHFVDPHGVVYTMIDKASGRPLDDAFFDTQAKSRIAIPGFTPTGAGA